MTINPILNVDSYKTSHYLQYPPGAEVVSSYVESRGGDYDQTVFFGLQVFLKECLSKPITREHIEEAGRGAGRTTGNRQVFQRHDQRLAFHEIDADVYRPGQACLRVTVEVQFLDIAHRVQEALAQGQQALCLVRHLFLADTRGLTHAHDLVRGQGT